MAGTSFDGTGPGAGSPFFDDLRQDKDLRNSFLHAIALTILAVIMTGVYYVYSILEPFIVPLFWALLSGVLLHPYKKGLTGRLRQSLMRLEKNDKNVMIAVTQNTFKSIDGIAEYIGEYFLEKWKLFVSLFISAVSL